jgi:hypothetical protein
MLAEPAEILRKAINISKAPPHAVVPLVSRIITRENVDDYLQNAVD